MKKREQGGFWYPRYYHDYKAATGHLTIAEHGALTLLLDEYYAQGGPIHAEPKRLMHLLRAHTDVEKEAVRAVLAEFFVMDKGKWRNNRADREIAVRNELIEKKRRAAVEGNNKRWNKTTNVVEFKKTADETF